MADVVAGEVAVAGGEEAAAALGETGAGAAAESTTSSFTSNVINYGLAPLGAYSLLQSASIDVTIVDLHGNKIISGVCVPGKLDTNLLENGDYIIPSVVKTFELLKTINYYKSIIANFTYNLTAFLSAITMSNKITDYTTKLSPQVFAGTLSNDDFNKSVSSYTKQLSDNYPNNYFMNLTKVQKAINDNLHILSDK